MKLARRQFLRIACAACLGALAGRARRSRASADRDAEIIREFTIVTDGVPGLRYLQRYGRPIGELRRIS